jgi:hypothetical protein
MPRIGFRVIDDHVLVLGSEIVLDCDVCSEAYLGVHTDLVDYLNLGERVLELRYPLL